MKRCLFMWFGLLVLTSCGAVRVSQSENQFKPSNTGFESGPGGVGMPATWTYGDSSRTSYEWATDTEVKRSGERSLRIRSVVESPSGFGGVRQCVVTPNNASSVHYAAFLKTDQAAQGGGGSGDGAGLWIRVANEAGTGNVAFDNMLSRWEPGVGRFLDDRRLYGTSDWTLQETTLKISPQRGRTCFGVLLKSRGTLWADDLKLVYRP
ncbi:MAG: hypothetical protein KY429_11550 [Actinobacteria bacterium]|nr:hypothetical protein [Actinomycetota bacterium]